MKKISIIIMITSAVLTALLFLLWVVGFAFAGAAVGGRGSDTFAFAAVAGNRLWICRWSNSLSR